MRNSIIYRTLVALILTIGAVSAASAADRLFIDAVYVEPGQTRVIAFNLDNEAPCYGFQTDITLPEGLKVVEENGSPLVDLTSRTDESFTVVSNILSPVSIRTGVFSTAHTAFTGHSGAVMTVSVTAEDNFAGGALTISNVHLVGDGDRDIPVADFSENIRNHPDNALYLPDFTISAGETKRVSLILDNESPFTALQTDIYMPEGLEIVEDSFTMCPRAADHTISSRSFSDGRTRVICHSASNELFTGSDGAIMDFDIHADKELADGTYRISLRDKVCSTASGGEYTLADSSTEVTNIHTGVDVIAPGDIDVRVIGGNIVINGLPIGEAAELYDASGIRVATAVSEGETTCIEANSGNLYILRIGASAIKILVP